MNFLALRRNRIALLIISLALIFLFFFTQSKIFSYFSDYIGQIFNLNSGTLQIDANSLKITDANGDFQTPNEDDFIDSPITYGTVRRFKFNINNLGTNAAKLNTELAVTWFDDTLSEAGIVFIFPSNISDADIISQIEAGDDSNALSKHDVDDQTLISTSAGARKGFKIPVDNQTILDSPLAHGTHGVATSPGSTEVNYEFKIAFTAFDESGMVLSDFNNQMLETNIIANAKPYNQPDGNWSAQDQARFNILSEVIPDTNNKPIISPTSEAKFEYFVGTDVDLTKFATAHDAEDGDITGNIVITSSPQFDKNSPGEYTIYYNVTDSGGKSADTYSIKIIVWNFIKIDNGQYHGVALGSNGSVWTWGYNSVGQRGLGHTTSASSYRSPTRIPQSAFGNKPIIDIAGSNYTSCALNDAGAAFCWGMGSYGALGNGGTSNSSSPQAVIMPSSVTFTSLSGAHGNGTYGLFVAVGSDMNAYTWGNGSSYRLGTGSTGNVTSPTKITDSNNIIQASQGSSGGTAVTTSGDVYVWGMNGFGQLALGNTTASNATTSRPQIVTGLPSNIIQTSTGGYANYGFTIARTSTGDVWGWGWDYGVNGNNGGNWTTPQHYNTLSNITDINTGADFSHFISNNDIYGVGYANYGELFIGNTTTQGPTPVKSTMANVAGNVGMVASGYDNAWILSKDGKTLWGIGFSDAAGQEFGSSLVQTTSTSSVVPWTFSDN